MPRINHRGASFEAPLFLRPRELSTASHK
jgi:hypothetical protein